MRRETRVVDLVKPLLSAVTVRRLKQPWDIVKPLVGIAIVVVKPSERARFLMLKTLVRAASFGRNRRSSSAKDKENATGAQPGAAPQAPKPAPGLALPALPALEGYLLKKHHTSTVRNWGKRWVEVDDSRGLLCYYRSQAASSERATGGSFALPLDEIESVEPVNGSDGLNCIRIVAKGKRTLVLKAPDKARCDAWVQGLALRIARIASAASAAGGLDGSPTPATRGGGYPAGALGSKKPPVPANSKTVAVKAVSEVEFAPPTSASDVAAAPPAVRAAPPPAAPMAVACAESALANAAANTSADAAADGTANTAAEPLVLHAFELSDGSDCEEISWEPQPQPRVSAHTAAAADRAAQLGRRKEEEEAAAALAAQEAACDSSAAPWIVRPRLGSAHGSKPPLPSAALELQGRALAERKAGAHDEIEAVAIEQGSGLPPSAEHLSANTAPSHPASGLGAGAARPGMSALERALAEESPPSSPEPEPRRAASPPRARTEPSADAVLQPTDSISHGDAAAPQPPAEPHAADASSEPEAEAEAQSEAAVAAAPALQGGGSSGLAVGLGMTADAHFASEDWDASSDGGSGSEAGDDSGMEHEEEDAKPRATPAAPERAAAGLTASAAAPAVGGGERPLRDIGAGIAADPNFATENWDDDDDE